MLPTKSYGETWQFPFSALRYQKGQRFCPVRIKMFRVSDLLICIIDSGEIRSDIFLYWRIEFRCKWSTTHSAHLTVRYSTWNCCAWTPSYVAMQPIFSGELRDHRTQARKSAGERSTLDLKPMRKDTWSPKQEQSVAPQNGPSSNNFFK